MVEILGNDVEDLPEHVDAIVSKIGYRSVIAQSDADHELIALFTDKRIRQKHVRASFVRNEVLYSFDSSLDQIRVAHEHFTTLILRRPQRVTKVQRRLFYRVPLETRTTYRHQIRRWDEDDSERHARIINLSEGGALIATAERLSEGAVIQLTVPSGKEGSPMKIMAQVIDVSEGYPSRQEPFAARVSFDSTGTLSLTSDQRELLIRYLFEQQRMMLQTRRLMSAGKKGS